MTTISDAYAAAVDAAIADTGITKNEFCEVMRTVLTDALSKQETLDFIDATAVEYERLGQINNPTFASWRNGLINDGKSLALAKFEAFQTNLAALPETAPLHGSAVLIDLRDDRDSSNGAIDRMDLLILAEPPGTVGKLVKEVLRDGKRSLQEHKQALKDQIQAITGDPDN